MKKFKLLPYLFVCVFGISCGQQNNHKENTVAQANPYKTEKRTVYGMDLAIPGPYELYINDISAVKITGQECTIPLLKSTPMF